MSTLADLLAVAERVESLAYPDHDHEGEVEGRACPGCNAEYQDLHTLARAVRALVRVAVGHEPVTPDVIDGDGIRHRGNRDYCGADGEEWPCVLAQALAAAPGHERAQPGLGW